MYICENTFETFSNPPTGNERVLAPGRMGGSPQPGGAGGARVTGVPTSDM